MPLLIEERSADIGHFTVARILPFRQKRMVGPFIFIDHFGPTQIGPNKYMDVDQHPHIGLATLTYLYEGEINHEDSIGSKVRITPGSVNLMIAGRGVTHTERTPPDLRNGNVFTSLGYQIWIALPKSFEDMEPEFHHVDKSELPIWTDHELQYKLISGTGFGRKSPVPSLSQHFLIELTAKSTQKFNTTSELIGEVGIFVDTGSFYHDGNQITKGQMLVFEEASNIEIEIIAGSRILLFGGTPFPENRFIHWNFVSSEKSKIDQAISNWKNRMFPKIENDDTYVEIKT